MSALTGYECVCVSRTEEDKVSQFLLLFLCVCFFLLLRNFCSFSPFCVPDGFGENVVSPVQIHDPVLQVEFPFVLTSVDLVEWNEMKQRGR